MISPTLSKAYKARRYIACSKDFVNFESVVHGNASMILSKTGGVMGSLQSTVGRTLENP